MDKPVSDAEYETVTAGMLADILRPIVLGGERSCLDGTQFVPLHRGTVTAIYQHLERLAHLDGEPTLRRLEMELATVEEQYAVHRENIAIAIEARRSGEAEQDWERSAALAALNKDQAGAG